MLKFQQGWGDEQYPLLTIDDVGMLANMRVTGSGLFGSATTAVPVQFKVQSGAAASAAFISGPSFDSTITLQSGAGHTAKLQLGVRLIAEGTTSISGAPDFSTFEIFNIGAPVPDASAVSMFPDSLKPDSEDSVPRYDVDNASSRSGHPWGFGNQWKR